MGGVIDSPDPPAPAPPPEPPEKTAAEREAEERQARLEAIARRRRGRQDTIETGYTGALLRERRPSAPGKSRLGG